jgi:ADP-heptose:LPS heptosyltransferase
MQQESLSRSLILFPGALGDFVCFLPTLNLIEQLSAVDLCARTEFRDLVSSQVRVHSVDSYEIRRLFVHQGADDERVRGFFAGYDAVYSWMGSGVADFSVQLGSVTQGKALLFPFRPCQGGIQQADYFLRCVAASPAEALPRLSLKADAIHWCKSYWQHHALFDRPVLALAPGSGAREKNWPVPWFAAVARWWRQRFQGVVILILGPAEEERAGYDVLCRDALQIRNLDLARLTAVLARCNLYLGNDSGTTHLAAAAGAPTAALFGPSDASQWAPRGKCIMTLTRQEECSPCGRAMMKGCLHRRCLTAMEPGTVIRQLEQWPVVASLTRRELSSNLTH